MSNSERVIKCDLQPGIKLIIKTTEAATEGVEMTPRASEAGHVAGAGEISQDVPAACGLGVRHVQSLLAFMCIVVLLMMKAHLGVTVVAMTSAEVRSRAQTNYSQLLRQHNQSNLSLIDALRAVSSTEGILQNEYNIIDGETNIWTAYRTYNWSKATQELVLNSFIFGYVLMAFPMGLICQHWGGKLPLQVALLVNGCTSIPIPWLTLWGGWRAVCVCRALQGATQAATMPATHTLLAAWVPASERGRLACYVYAGSSLGTVLAFQLGGVLAASWGWPATFWATGALSLVAFVVFSAFGAASPATHNHISIREKILILGHADRKAHKRRKTPWKAILGSKHVWGVFVSHMGALVSNVFCYIQIPSYVHHVLGVNIKNSGLLSSIPFITTCVASSGFGMLSDYWTNRKILTVKSARQLFNTISEFGFAACIVAVSFTANVPLAMTLFVLATTVHSAMQAGSVLTYIDMAPNYSGAMVAVGNTLANLLLLAMPLLVANIVTDLSSQFQWRIMFCTVAGLAVLGNLSYVCLMTADVQPWNDFEYEVTDDEARKKLQHGEI